MVASTVRGAIVGKYDREWTISEKIDSIRGVVETRFAASTAENWEIVRERVTENPLIDEDGEPIVKYIIR